VRNTLFCQMIGLIMYLLELGIIASGHV